MSPGGGSRIRPEAGEEPSAEPPPDPDAVRDAAARRLLDRIVVGRLALAPVLGTLQLTAMALAPDPWRLALGAGTLAAMAALFGVEYRRHRAGRERPGALALNLVGMGWIQVAVMVLLGGLEGPLTPLLPLAALVAALAFGRALPTGLVVGAQLAAVWALVAAELGAGWSPGIGAVAARSPADLGLQALALSLMVGAAWVLGSYIRGLVGAALGDAVAAHDSERRAHAEHARELAALSAEIAHELKNPLASVHGLGTLLARDLEGKPAERLAVLRGEVDRMRDTLDAFLDFSRPLLPLTVADVAFDELAQEVAALCEGLARSRGASIRVDGRCRLRADRRKLRQVLVNLVQNALEVAPARSEVEVACAPGGFEVRDRGPGVDPAVAALLFSPGATTRPRGSGLGLAIARGIVEQHGGTLVLEPRDGGGTVARATLAATPREGRPPVTLPEPA